MQTPPTMPPETINDAASVIMLRGSGSAAQVLMGQRAAGAAFMPDKFVFPGGRVDTEDNTAAAPPVLATPCRDALARETASTSAALPDILITAALRELYEETGLHLARPRIGALRFVFRAITPQGRPRRFDARFFLADAADFRGDCAGFSAASGELAALQWLPLPAARALNLPFITQVILAEIQHGLTGAAGAGVPFFDNSGSSPRFSRL